MSSADHIRAATGVRTRRTVFEQGAARHELSTPKRTQRRGDPDDGGVALPEQEMASRWPLR